MEEHEKTAGFVFPRWTNLLAPLIAILVVGGAFYVPTLVGLGFSPKATDVGYAPVQPVAYSHALHAGKLGIDCRYCHSTVEKAPFAALPPTQTCMNCHTNIRPTSTALLPIRESWATGKPVEWVRVHDLPDYVYFNHSAHVNNGIGCISCHGRVDQMEVVKQDQTLSMSWCLDCHRNPEKNLRPKDQITNMRWQPPAGVSQIEFGTKLKSEYGIRNQTYMTSCSTCHR